MFTALFIYFKNIHYTQFSPEGRKSAKEYLDNAALFGCSEKLKAKYCSITPIQLLFSIGANTQTNNRI